MADKALALPPLSREAAEALIAETRIARLLGGYRGVPAASVDALVDTLLSVAALVTDVPEVRELDLNPILIDADGAVVVDARVAVAAVAFTPRPGVVHPRFAIQPYPTGRERRHALSDGREVILRPIKPEDERLYPDFLARVAAEDLRLRFFAPVKEMGHRFLARLTQIDYAREIAFVALDASGGDLLGIARLHADANHERGEYAVLVRSDLQGKGLGWALMQAILDWGREQGLAVIEGQVFARNDRMLRMCRELGFDVEPDLDDTSFCRVRFWIQKGRRGDEGKST